VYPQTHPIEQHPDLVALRAESEGAAVRPLAQVTECLSLLAGLYLAISPWVVGFHAMAPTLTANNLITGLALVAFALGFVPAFERTHSTAMAAALVGVWTIIAPWVIQSSPTDAGIIASNVVIGSIVFLLGLARMAQAKSRPVAAAVPPPAERPTPR
jgi:hypothetical protein